MKVNKEFMSNPHKDIFDSLKLVMEELLYQANQNKILVESLTEEEAYWRYNINKSDWLNKQNSEIAKWELQYNELFN